MKSVRKEFIKILTGKSLWILIIFLAVISVASGFSGPTSIVAKRFGTRVGKNVYMVPFAVIYSFSQILNIVLALMTTLSVHDLQKPKTDAAAGFRQGLIARWIAGTGAAAMSILPCSLLWCMKRKAFWPVSEKITDYDRKLIVFLAAFLVIVLCQITCCYVISLLTQDFIMANLICLIPTFAFGMFSILECSFSVVLPVGAMTLLKNLVVNDTILTTNLFFSIFPCILFTVVLCLFGFAVNRKRRFK